MKQVDAVGLAGKSAGALWLVLIVLTRMDEG